MRFKVKLKPKSDETVKVRYRTEDGSAAAPGDYAARSGRLKFKPGTKARRVDVPTVEHPGKGGTDTMSLVLRKPEGAKIKRKRGTGSIVRRPVPVCPANASADFYVNPVVERPPGVVPTGVSVPGYCSFPTIASAIGSVNSRGVGSARIIATGAGAGQAVFGSEQFPLTLPAGAVLTTDQDPDLGGSGFDPGKYVIQFTGTSPSAVVVNGPNTISGFTLKNARATSAARMIECTGGSVQLLDAVLDGSGGAGAIDTGVGLASGCAMVIDSDDDTTRITRIRKFDGTGISVNAGATLTLQYAKVHDNGGPGLVLDGASSILDSEIAFNGAAGLVVNSASTILCDNIRDNAGPGVLFHSPPPEHGFQCNWVHNNARTGATTWTDAQIRVAGAGTYDLSGNDGSFDPCSGSRRNRISSYEANPVGPQDRVGLTVGSGASVDARYNVWRYASTFSNVFIDSSTGSMADLSQPCGTYIIVDNFPGDPVN